MSLFTFIFWVTEVSLPLGLLRNLMLMFFTGPFPAADRSVPVSHMKQKQRDRPLHSKTTRNCSTSLLLLSSKLHTDIEPHSFSFFTFHLFWHLVHFILFWLDFQRGYQRHPYFTIKAVSDLYHLGPPCCTHQGCHGPHLLYRATSAFGFKTSPLPPPTPPALLLPRTALSESPVMLFFWITAFFIALFTAWALSQFKLRHMLMVAP